METSKQLRDLVEKFVGDLGALMEVESRQSARNALEALINGPAASKKVPMKKKNAPSAAASLHGKYIGRLHSFKGAERERIKKVRAKDGAAAALKLMSKLRTS
jgi:hypothetical protein